MKITYKGKEYTQPGYIYRLIDNGDSYALQVNYDQDWNQDFRARWGEWRSIQGGRFQCMHYLWYARRVLQCARDANLRDRFKEVKAGTNRRPRQVLTY